MTGADGTEIGLLPSMGLIERVLAADVSYTMSRMRVLECIPGNPIGIGYRRIDDRAVALVSIFLPAFTRVIGLRPGHEGEIEDVARDFVATVVDVPIGDVRVNRPLA